MINRNVLASVGSFLLAVVLALLLGSFGLVVAGLPVGKTYRIMFEGAVGSAAGWAGALVFTAPIIFCALAALVSFKMQVWNIGGGGQLIMGAFGATFVALKVGFLPDALLLPAVLFGGLLAGALWALIPALLKLWLGVSEMLSSLMLNYVAVLLVDYFVFGPWKDPEVRGWPLSRPFPQAAMLPSFGSTGVHLGLPLGVIAGLVLFIILRESCWGFQVRVIGHSPTAARYAGMGIGTNVVLVFLVSGALAGLGGVGEVAGVGGRLYHLTPTYGYTGILVSWLAGLNPLAVLILSLVYGILLQGGAALKMAGVGPSLVLMIQAAIVVFSLAGLTLANKPWRSVRTVQEQGMTQEMMEDNSSVSTPEISELKAGVPN